MLAQYRSETVKPLFSSPSRAVCRFIHISVLVPKCRVRRSAQLAVIPLVPCMMAVRWLVSTSVALASAWADRPAGSMNSRRSTFPGVTGGMSLSCEKEPRWLQVPLEMRSLVGYLQPTKAGLVAWEVCYRCQATRLR